MSLIGLVKTLTIGGLVAGTLGISGIITGSTPPPAGNLEDEEETILRDEIQNTGSSTDSGYQSNNTQQHTGSSLPSQTQHTHATQGTGLTSSDSDTSQQNIRHCLVVLTGRRDKHSDKKILVCQDSNKHLNIEKEKSRWGSMKWYLHDSTKNTLNEISGLSMENEKPKRLWNWFWYEDFARWYEKGHSFWKGKYWTPYFASSNNSIFKDAEFDLPFNNGDTKFDPIYRRLNEYYSTRCGWRASRTCSRFKVTKSFLSSYLNELTNLGTQPHEKICLILEKPNSSSNNWTIKTPCPEILKK